MASNGSIQNIDGIPQHIKDLYKTVYEMSQKVIIDMAADRGAFVCQSQSLNLFVESPTFAKLSSMHFYAWRKGLKTGMYYLRSKAAVDPIKFTLSDKYQRKYVATDGQENGAEQIEEGTQQGKGEAGASATSAEAQEFSDGASCSMEDGCLMCGS